MPISQRLSATVAALCLIGMPSSASAILEGEPFAFARWVHDDNLFRFANEAEALAENGDSELADVHRQLGLGAALQYTWGLQKVQAAARYTENDYRRFSSLDHSAWEIGSQLIWQVGSRYDGTLSAQFNRSLQNFEDRDTSDNSLVREWVLRSFSSYALTPRWDLLTDLSASQERYSLQSQQFSNLDEIALENGTRYEISPLTVLGASLGYTRGHYPERNSTPGSTVASEYEQWEANLVAERNPSPVSQFRLETGYTSRRSTDSSGRNFGAVTGSLNYRREWFVDLVSNLRIYRQVDSVEEQDANFRLLSGVSLQLDYRWSPKLSSFGRAERRQARFEGSPAQNVGGQVREDDGRIDELGLSYKLFWWLTIDAGMVWENRRSNRVDRGYDDERWQLGIEMRYD